MTTFFLVRHGETTGGPGDPSLTLGGVEQARAVGVRLASRPIGRVFTSPLARAHETARVIADAVATDVETDVRLRERANWGDVPDQSWTEFAALWERSNEDRDFVVPGGSSARQAGRRAADFVRDVVAREPDREVVAVTHGGLIVDLLLEFVDEAELFARAPELRHMPWCAVTKLDVKDGRAEVGGLADWPGGGS